MNKLIIAALAMAASASASAGCISGHWINNVAAMGKIVTLENNAVLRIDDVDTVDSELWLTTEDLVICPVSGNRVEVINQDDSGSQVAHATLISGSI